MKILTLVIGPLRNNCFIISGNGKDAVIIDPAGQYPTIKNKLEESGLTGRLSVLLTHAHFDHIGAVSRFQSDGAEVYLHSDDEDKIAVQPFGMKIASFTPDKILEDGQILNLANLNIKIIHTPGHTSGSVCFLINDMLFSGDTLFLNSVGRWDFPSGNFMQLEKSIRERIYTMAAETKVFPGHGEKTTVGHEIINNEIIKNA